jgi:hypothetical protein
MKNIHLLPTDKPSRLCINGKNQMHIYITSDGFIEEGDFSLNLSTKNIIQYDGIKGLDSYYKKIILTTDRDLIKDGVQAIDNEFLEWFVKNPSCDEVEVKKGCKIDCNKFILNGVNSICCGDKEYKIIIPKEKPKQDLEKEMFELEQELDIPSFMRWHNSKPKQETLEEAVENYTKDGTKHYMEKTNVELGFIAGAKWQAERMYSETEVLQLLLRLQQTESYDNLYDWFEQFKKK